MKRNMRIGIIMNRVYREMNQKIITGILKQAYSLGYSAAVFSTEEEKQDEMGHYGENNIFTLINFDLFDGFIFVPYTFVDPATVKHIVNFLSEKCSKPVVCIGEDFSEFECIWQNDRLEFSNVVRHLIEQHECRKIICLTGPDGATVSLEREAGYRDAMKAAGLEVAEDDVIYGDFWKYTAVQLADDLSSGARPMVDAVACANDSMAIFLCDALIERNIKIPQDIKIIGYDGSSHAQFHKPGISTYRTSWLMLGVNAMVRLYGLMTNGDKCEYVCFEEGKLHSNISCGCPAPAISESVVLVESEMIEQRFLDNNMSNQLLNTNNLADFSLIVSNWFYYIFSEEYYMNEQFDVCLCTDWDVVDSNGFAQEIRTDGYSEKMITLFGEPHFMQFPSKQMFPPRYLQNDTTSVSFFVPVHYQEHCFGYAILTLNGIADGFTMHYPRFCKDLGNSLECLCIRNRLKSMTYRAFLSETRDALTGAFRSSTYAKYWLELSEKAKLFDEELHLCLTSVSGLQQINETYGQVEGDNVLMQTASILMGCCQNNEMCIRVAGNEFLLIGSHSEQNPGNSSLVDTITERIERYNQTSGKPYRIQIYTVSNIESPQHMPDAETAYNKIKKLLLEKKKSSHSRAETAYYADFNNLRRDIYLMPEKDWSIGMCSGILGMSTSHFQRLYKSIFNISCMRDIQNSKLCHAKNLLLQTNDTLQSIAEKCGYDYSHFMRMFKKEVGMTPTEYRSGVHLNQESE